MNPLNSLINKAAEIINASWRTQLSLSALCILVTATLVVLLFLKAPVIVRIMAFFFTLALMAMMMILASPRPEWKAPVDAKWDSREIDSDNLDYYGINTEVAKRINEMKPRDLNSIKGFISQEPRPAGDYKVVVFCVPVDGDRAPIKVTVDQINLTHSQSRQDFVNTLNSTRGRAVILGFYHGIQGDSVFYAYQDDNRS